MAGGKGFPLINSSEVFPANPQDGAPRAALGIENNPCQAPANSSRKEFWEHSDDLHSAPRTALESESVRREREGGEHRGPPPLLTAGRLSLSLPSAEHGWTPAPLKPAFDSCSDNFNIY
ncbi:hypothetical protein O3P69_004452 [Scylla paramamosain]|uniref:Uncharacterized protein n=1 Tax=Scylla paramamosain TaxID=85552 RepID=A0AAW0UG54_SCYPA